MNSSHLPVKIFQRETKPFEFGYKRIRSLIESKTNMSDSSKIVCFHCNNNNVMSQKRKIW